MVMRNFWNVEVETLKGEIGAFEFTSKKDAQSFIDEIKEGVVSTKLIKIDNERVITQCYEHEEEELDTGMIYSWTEKYGYEIAPTFIEGVDIKDGKLFIGDMEIPHFEKECVNYPDLAGRIPSLFMIRSFDYYPDLGEGRSYPSLTAGLDLLADGRIWIGGISHSHTLDSKDKKEQFFNSGQEAIDYLNANLRDGWMLVLEEPMSIS